MTKKIYQSFIDYIVATFLMIFIFILIRFFEYTFLSLSGIKGPTLNILFSSSINFDSFYVIALSCFFLLPYILISILSPFTALLFYRIFVVLNAFVALALTHFFLTNHTLLTGIVFTYSVGELLSVISTEIISNRMVLWFMHFIFLCLLITGLIYFPKKVKSLKTKWLLPVIYLIFSFATIANMKHYSKSIDYFENQFQYHLGNSKISFLLEGLYNVYKEKQKYEKLDKKDIYNTISDYQLKNREFFFVQKEYPLIHDEKYRNVLGKYFEISETKPNVVFLIVESLTGYYCGKKSFSYHLTPYIESLIDSGLYWENFLSNTERTYGVLPNSLGSLPFGTNERGFMNIPDKNSNVQIFPKHTSIVKMLKVYGYQANMFYGGSGSMDNMNYFVNETGFDYFMDVDKFDTVHYKLPDKANYGWVWGYNDKDMFKHSFENLDKQDNTKPFLNVYLTITIHTPYNLCTKEYYTDKFIQERLKTMDPHSGFFSHKYSNDFMASLFFTDDAVQGFFDQYRKRPDFKNTIFFIFGDHGLVSGDNLNGVEVYNIPLIIYSPLLKSKGHFKGLSTQQDIVPSLIALLEGNFNFKFPPEKHWIGKGLDTSTVFNSNVSAALNLLSNQLPNYIYHDYLITSQHVFKLDQDLKTTEVKDPEIVKQLYKIVNDYKIVNNYVCRENKIWK